MRSKSETTVILRSLISTLLPTQSTPTGDTKPPTDANSPDDRKTLHPRQKRNLQPNKAMRRLKDDGAALMAPRKLCCHKGQPPSSRSGRVDRHVELAT